MRRRTTMTLLAGGLLTISACGSTSDTPAAGEALAATTGTETPSSTTGAAPATTVGPTTVPAAPPSTAGETQPSAASTVAPTTEAPVTIALPDDGCSADNSPSATDVADGPLPALEVRAESTGNALPDLAVRRINCAGGWVNLKNEIPAATPLLVWFWAPH